MPALVAGRDGALWLGTALGLTRLRDGQSTPVLFHREVTVQGDVATLEAFFQAVAQAILRRSRWRRWPWGGCRLWRPLGARWSRRT